MQLTFDYTAHFQLVRLEGKRFLKSPIVSAFEFLHAGMAPGWQIVF